MAVLQVLACDGCFVGLPAVLSLILAVAILIGTLYMLLWSNLGTRLAYLVLMVSLMGWMTILSAIWLLGVPGTTPGTGPRAREAGWIPFTPTSEQAGDFRTALDQFPNGWDKLSEVKSYPGKIDPHGELENVRTQVTSALARLAEKQGTEATKALDWKFHPSDLAAATSEEKALPAATVRVFQQDTPLLFGVTIAAKACKAGDATCRPHPEVTVFAFRDKGIVFLYALYFVIVSVAGFAVHLWMLGRYEMKRRAAPEPALA